MSSNRVAVLSTLGLLVTAAPARAQEAIPFAAVAVSSDAAAKKAAVLVAAHARQAFATMGRYEHIDLERFLAGDVPKEAQSALKQAEKRFLQGRNAYDELDLDTAAKGFKDAADAYASAAAYLEDSHKLAESLMFLGASYMLNADEDSGRRAFNQAAIFDRTAKMDPNLFPPSMIEAYNEALSGLQSAPKGELTVVSTPSYARVYVNGQFRGVTPGVVVGDLPAGDHLVRLEKDGFRHWGKVVTVGAGTKESLACQLTASRKLDDYEQKIDAAAKDPQAAVALAQWLGVTEVFVARVSLSGDKITVDGSLHAIGTPDKPVFAASKVVPFDLIGEQVRQFIVSTFSPKAIAEAQTKALAQTGGSKGEGVDQGRVIGVESQADSGMKPYITYSMYGLAGASIIGGAVLGIVAMGKQDDAETVGMADVDTTGANLSESLGASANNLALGADVFFLVGLAAAGAATAMLVLWQEGGAGPEAEDVFQQGSVGVMVDPLGGAGVSWAGRF